MRIVAAMVEIVAEHGLADATVARIVACAGVSRRTFYELFADREDCFLAAFDAGVSRVSRSVLDSYDPGRKWAERLRTALTDLLAFLDEEPNLAQLLVVGSLGGGTNALERRRRVLAQMITFVNYGRKEVKAGASLPPVTAEGVVGGALSIVHARMVTPERGRLVELVNPLMSMIVLPYLGPAAARKELARPVPKPRVPPARACDPLRDLGMRLTYRTVRALRSVAVNPGSSNREIGLASGIADQGQISKLLSRLERFELIHNAELASGAGAPNAWTLTPKGLEVERAMSGETDLGVVDDKAR